MELMGDGLIAFLAAVGVSTILWLLAETLLRRQRPVAEAVLVLPVRGDGVTLKRALFLRPPSCWRTAGWMRRACVWRRA